MKYIKGQNRTQSYLFPISLDDAIDPENEVRLIDVFVDSLQLKEFGFKVDFIENGRPAYYPGDLLKLYIYGYLNKVRSSRDLEKESKRNIEMMWLLNNLKPDHNTISNFRRDNPKAIKKVFRQTVKIAQYFNLIGGTLLAGDSTKLRAQNSKKNNFNQKKIDRHLEYIENKLTEYNAALASSDGDEKVKLEQEIQTQENRKLGYKEIEKQLKNTNQTQASTSDPDSRHMIVRNNITEVAYNIQTTVDEKNKIPIDYKVTNTNDSKAMGNMLQRAKSILHSNEFTALYDKGYHTGSEFEIANKLGIHTIVAIPRVAAQAPDPAYNVENFTYDKASDHYICPEGQTLITTGTKHKAKTYHFKRYTTKECMTCPVKEKCSKATYGKGIQRSEYQELLDLNKQRVKEQETYYKRRQAIVEHPYGTIKRQWGFSYILTKYSMQRASADVGFMMTVYNLRRIINIIGVKTFKKHLQEVVAIFLVSIAYINFKLAQYGYDNNRTLNNRTVFNRPLNRLYLDQINIYGRGF